MAAQVLAASEQGHTESEVQVWAWVATRVTRLDVAWFRCVQLSSKAVMHRPKSVTFAHCEGVVQGARNKEQVEGGGGIEVGSVQALGDVCGEVHVE